jgi:hypothetical protein
VIYHKMTEFSKTDSEILLYQTEDGQTRMEVQLHVETVWLGLNQLAELFQQDKSVISRHIKNIFDEGELEQDRLVANFAATAVDGKTNQVEYFNFDVIISVGYRAKSHRGTQFCIWATHRFVLPSQAERDFEEAIKKLPDSMMKR